MGLTKDLEKMSNAIKAKFGGISASKGGNKKSFHMLHFFMVVFVAAFLAYLFYHCFIRKK